MNLSVKEIDEHIDVLRKNANEAFEKIIDAMAKRIETEQIEILVRESDEAEHRLLIAMSERTKAQEREILGKTAERILESGDLKEHGNNG